MTLDALIRGAPNTQPVGSATAIPATAATEEGGKAGTVARVATIAVATPGSAKTEGTSAHSEPALARPDLPGVSPEFAARLSPEDGDIPLPTVRAFEQAAASRRQRPRDNSELKRCAEDTLAIGERESGWGAMTTAALLQAAEAAGMAIRVDGDALAWEIFPPGLWDEIRGRKAEILAHVHANALDRGGCIVTLATMIAARERDLSGISPEPAAEDAVAPIAGLPNARAPVNLDEACDGVAGITPAQFRALLSPEDVADIEAGGIHPKILKAYALSFANHGGAGEANNTRHLLTAAPVSEIFPMTPSPCESGTDGWGEE
jgi:hypothetical protein